ncbi:UDP-N-acetylmuramate dehydrogenase [bacterium]|nr:UDP-N-acetylmuramate dehydrogenase [bacterium]
MQISKRKTTPKRSSQAEPRSRTPKQNPEAEQVRYRAGKFVARQVVQNSKFKIIKKFKRNISLKNFTTFKIGGRAKYFFEAKTKGDLIRAISWAKEKKLPFFIFGGGSNLLVSDEGFEGLVIKMKNEKCKIKNENSKCKIFCESGVKLDSLVKLATENNLSGIEWAAGIPGTVGGAIYGNAGAFGCSMGSIVHTVEALDVSKGKVKEKIFCNKECRFHYKDSVFKRNKNLIIFSCVLSLYRSEKNKIRQRIREYLTYRQKNQPLDFPSAGSVFKNVELTKVNEKAIKEFPQSKSFILQGKVPAGFLIERCSLKGKKIGGAQISKKHANFIVNVDGACARDVLKLIDLAKKKVKAKFGLVLREEIQYLK